MPRPPEELRSVRLAAGPIAYVLRRSPRAHRLRLSVEPDRGVTVTIPARGSWAPGLREIESFLREREAWILRHLDRSAQQRAAIAARGRLGDGAIVPYRGEPHTLRVTRAEPGRRRSTVVRVGEAAGDVLHVELARADRRSLAGVLESWFRDRARAAIAREIERHAAALGVEPVATSVRDQRSRWGSASRERRLSFSWRLVLAPPEALESVVIHELAHLRVFGHGPRFWALVAARRPDHAGWRRWLREHSYELHATLADTGEPELPATARA